MASIKIEDITKILDEGIAAEQAFFNLRRAILETIEDAASLGLPPESTIAQIKHEVEARHPDPQTGTIHGAKYYYSRMKGRILNERKRQQARRRGERPLPQTQPTAKAEPPAPEPPAPAPDFTAGTIDYNQTFEEARDSGRFTADDLQMMFPEEFAAEREKLRLAAQPKSTDAPSPSQDPAQLLSETDWPDET